MGPAPGRDPRVEKIRRHLREKTMIPKEDFLDFVQVYSHFGQAGYKVRPGIVTWILENRETVRRWLPDIFKQRPGYFDNLRPGTKLGSYEEYKSLAEIGFVTGQPLQASVSLSLSPATPTTGRSRATSLDSSDPEMLLDIPTKPKEKTLADFGTPIPDPALHKRPGLSGKVQQQVWLSDVRAIHNHLRSLKKWLNEVANDLSPHDPIKDTLFKAIGKVPDFSLYVHTAELCFEDVKTPYEQSRADLEQKRAEVSRLRHYSPRLNLEGEDEEDEDVAAPASEPGGQDLTSIWVETNEMNRRRQEPQSAGGDFSVARFNPVDATPQASGSGSALPRRSAFPPAPNPESPSLRRKQPHPGSPSARSCSVYSLDNPDLDDDGESVTLPNMNTNPKPTSGHKSVWSVGNSDNDDGGPRRPRKRARTEGKRPSQAQALGVHSREGNAPVADMG